MFIRYIHLKISQAIENYILIYFITYDRYKYGIVDPAFRLMRFPLDGELDFYLKN